MNITGNNSNVKSRTEHDFLGEKQIPDQYYFGVQTMRALEIGRASCRERVLRLV